MRTAVRQLLLLQIASLASLGCYAGPPSAQAEQLETGDGGSTSKADSAGTDGSGQSAGSGNSSEPDPGSSGPGPGSTTSGGPTTTVSTGPTTTASAASTSGGPGSTTGGDEPVALGPSPGCGTPMTHDWYGSYELSWGVTTPEVWLEVDGVMRQFLLRLPSNYDENTPYPIVFSLHGSSALVESAWGYNPPNQWPGGEVITVMPAGQNNNWDFSVNGDDVEFFDAINTFLGERLCVDEGRRYVQGVSGGAVMTHTIACARGDQIRGIAAAAGALLPDEIWCNGSVSAFLIHGQADTVVSFQSGVAARDAVLARAGCSQSTHPHPDAPCQVYDDCDQQEVIWCEHDGAHVDHVTLQLRDDVLGFFQSLL